MDRRSFIATGTATLVVSNVSGPVAALAEAERQRLWYESHCCGCGLPYCPEWLAAQTPPPVSLLCEWCLWHKLPQTKMPIPGDWSSGLYEDPNAKPYL